ncbi:helix-turn-helix transcriptional regulator [Luteimonas sp. 22616]|uniref:helix-turn-helix transcriptional regulator n=1 Tax=Luteimonas sp. 22616 TaxID=3453951 RepID=UPI003F870CF7
MKKQDSPLVAAVPAAPEHDHIVFAPSDLLNEKEVATMLGIATGTVRNWRSLRIGPTYVKLGKRAVRYRRVDVESFITSGMARMEA